MTAVLYGAALMVVLGCWPAPGRGAKADRGYRRAAPIITALAQYRQAHGTYPDSLPELVPTYLARSALDVPVPAGERYPLEYRTDSTGYELTFRYAGPGMNRCRYRSAVATWSCGGYF